MTYFIPAGTTITLRSGETLVGREWNAEHEQIVMDLLTRHPKGCATPLLASALGRGLPETRHFMTQLLERGKVENVGNAGRAQWVRLDTSVNERLVVEAHKANIRAYLLGRRELPGRIATELRLPKDEVVETCKAMMLTGDLSGTRVGMTFIYALGQRHEERRVSPETLANLPMSEEARFRQELEALNTRSPEPTYNKAYRPKYPLAPADWVAVTDLSQELKRRRETITAALGTLGLPCELMSRASVKGKGFFTSPQGACAMREWQPTPRSEPKLRPKPKPRSRGAKSPRAATPQTARLPEPPPQSTPSAPRARHKQVSQTTPPPDVPVTTLKPLQNSRRGRISETSKETLRLHLEPLGTPALAQHLGIDITDAWDRIKTLQHSGYLERVDAGVFRTTALGRKLLEPPQQQAVFLGGDVPPPPAGSGWTPAREAWLREHFALLGHQVAAQHLGTAPGTVWAKARRLKLKFGEVPGFTLLMPVAERIAALHGTEPSKIYPNLWARARKAGIMQYAPGDTGKQSRRPLVPVEWAEGVILERTPPSSSDMSLRELRSRLGLSLTQATRLVQHTYLRTVTGQQPSLHLSRAEGEALMASHVGQERQPSPGKAGLRAALELAGPEGHTETELKKALGVSRAAVRQHLRHLAAAGDVECHRSGTATDPFVWRLTAFENEPEPSPRRPDTSHWGNHSGTRKRSAKEEARRALKAAQAEHLGDALFPRNTPEPAPPTNPTTVKRPVVTAELERLLREALPPSERRKPGRTAAIAQKYGLSVGQVRSALSRLPTPAPEHAP